MFVQALRIGKKIEIRKLQKALLFSPALKDPYVIKVAEESYVVAFKYGVVVFWGMKDERSEQAMAKIHDYVDSPIENPTREILELIVGAKEDKIGPSHIEVTDLTVEKVAIISEVLSRSVALEYFETEIEDVMNGFGTITDQVSKGNKIKLSNKALLKKVGFAMNIQHVIISQFAMLDKPDLTWDCGELDSFYKDLSEEYEIEDRYATLSKKLEVIFRNIEFIMNFLDTRRGFFMELIIILLIAVEIVLFLFEKFAQ